MIIVYNLTNNPDWLCAINIDSINGLKSARDSITGWNGSPTMFNGENTEETTTRFNDIIEAMAADQKVYDVRKDVGYWKEKASTEKKTSTRGRKPKAEESAPAEHTPAPKK